MIPYDFSFTQAIVLAAGKGTRMRSQTAKVLHDVLGRSMLEHVLDALEALNVGGMTAVVGHASAQVKQALKGKHQLTWVQQDEQLGTGHAVQLCESTCSAAEHVLIVCGDTPLLRTETLAHLLHEHIKQGYDISVLSAELDKPHGYGRICRDEDGNMLDIVEEKDASDEVRKISEVSSGIFCVRREVLFRYLQNIDNQNEQQEYYLPAIIPLAVADGARLQALMMPDADDMLGVNNRTQLRQVTEKMQMRIIHAWEAEGVSIEHAQSVRIDVSVQLGSDTYIRAGSQLLGSTHIGDGCDIGPYAVIASSWVDDGVQIHAFTHMQGAHVSTGSQVGPYARLRPEARLAEGVKIGNFVEVKKAVIGEGSKVNHLSYVGDSDIGRDCNLGAGTITCNYDGANKHQTVIEDDVFVGSGTRLIAPIHVGQGATIGAGSIVTQDVAAGGLTLSDRTEQRHVKGWKRAVKK